MVLKNKKAFMITFGLKILLLLIILLSSGSVACKFINNVVGASPKEQSIAQFNTFVAQVESLSYVKSSYSSSYIQLGLNEGYYVVGFSDKRNSEINEEHDVIKIPSKCESSGSCICLYQKKPNPKKVNANVLTCRTLENIDYLIANKLFTEVLRKTSDESITFLQGGSNFVGSTITNTDLQRTNYLYNSISWFMIKNTFASVYSQTHNLGFYSDQEDLYYFALTADRLQVVPLYVELINYEGSSSLIFFPYNSGLFNRKYFLSRQYGVDSCEDNFLNAVIKKEDGTLKYCFKEGGILTESDDSVEACPIGEVQTMCACGPRVISNGYCLVNPSEGQEDSEEVIAIFPLDFCVSNSGTCSGYYDEFTCNYDACNTGNICKWDKAKKECKSGCPNPRPGSGCGFYDEIRCSINTCNFGLGRGCTWNEESNRCLSPSGGSNLRPLTMR